MMFPMSSRNFWKNTHFIEFACRLHVGLDTPLRFKLYDSIWPEFNDFIKSHEALKPSILDKHPILRYLVLNEELWYHRHRYYSWDRPGISDAVYDILEREFKDFCTKYKKCVTPHCALFHVGRAFGSQYLCRELKYAPVHFVGTTIKPTKDQLDKLFS